MPHLRLFCIAPGFLNNPVSIQDDDATPALPGVPGLGGPSPPAEADNGPDWIQFNMGTDNPYFDLRRPGDPGGVGYYRVNTQVQLLDSPTTACTMDLQAVTPSGIQFAGMPDGPTVFSPAFSVFHALSESTAVQGFVAKNVAVSGADGPRLIQRNLQCGMAVQRPIVADGPEGVRSLFLSVGALGQVRPERDNLQLMPTCDLLPGLHWYVNDNWWLSSAVLLPIGPTTRTTPGQQWQLTCSVRF